MKLQLSVLLVFVLMLFCGKPQIVWQSRIDTGTDEQAVKLLATADRLILVANQGKKEQGRLVWLVQYLDRQGRPVKRQTYAEGSFNIARDACLDYQNNLYLCGYTRLYDTTLCLIIKTGADTRTRWKKGLAIGAASWANGICPLENGVAVTGGMETAQGNDLWIAVLDSTGRTVWSRNYHFAEPTEGWKIKSDSRGNLTVLGKFCSGPDLLLMQTTPDGDTIWSRRYDSGGRDEPGNLLIDQFNNILAVGTARLADSTRCILLEYTADGGVVRKVAYGENAQAEGADAGIAPDGTIVICGTLLSPKQKQLLVFEYSPNATSIWERHLTLGASAEGKSLVFSNGLAVAADLGGPDADIAVIELNFPGNTTPTAR
ncbi:MAG: hypothetical protein ACPL0F_03930 [bacterium]|jgi:hypothetical protein